MRFSHVTGQVVSQIVLDTHQVFRLKIEHTNRNCCVCIVGRGGRGEDKRKGEEKTREKEKRGEKEGVWEGERRRRQREGKCGEESKEVKAGMEEEGG